jgi:hypothetical protein
MGTSELFTVEEGLLFARGGERRKRICSQIHIQAFEDYIYSSP